MIELLPISKTIPKDDILRCVNYNANDLVFTSGSLIEGIGNEKSDLDIFVVVADFARLKTDSTITYDNDSFKVAFTNINGIGGDIEYWSLSSLESLIDQLNSIDFTDTTKRSLSQLKVGKSDFETLASFLHRFINSKCVFNSDLYNNYYKKLNLNNYFSLMTRYYVNMVDNSYEDITGNLQKGELETALIISRNTLIKATAAYIFSKHESVDRDKWVYIKLKALSKENLEVLEVLNKFNDLYFSRSTTSKLELERLVEDYVLFINKIIKLCGKL
ncbi:hypothetical protein [Bacillus mycoides]|uniref:hypothetical protein n=1 Tax=Bacillus mycoides TaxID=1405 RepID=UPI003D64D926